MDYSESNSRLKLSLSVDQFAKNLGSHRGSQTTENRQVTYLHGLCLRMHDDV